MNISEKIEFEIKKLIKNKLKIDGKKVLKKLKFNIKNETIEEKKEIFIGNEGNVFDSIILGTNIEGDKIVILYNNKKEEPYYLLIDTTSSKEIKELIEKINKKEIDLKNKSLELTTLKNLIYSKL